MKLKSLNKDYRLFTNIVVSGSIIISLAVLFFSYKNFRNSVDLISEETAKKVNQNLTESILYVENFANFVSSEIVKKDYITEEEIAAIFINTRPKIDQKTQNIFTWTFFDFINSDNQVIASSLQGLLIKPILISKEKRSWIAEARKKPWKLLSSKSDIGIISKEKIIPFGFGITKKNNKFLGIVSVGMNVEKIKGKLESVSSSPYNTITLLGEDNSIIFTSTNFEEAKINVLSEDLKKFDSASKAGFIRVGKENFYYQPNENYRLKVLIGVNQKIFLSELRKEFISKAINTLYLTIFFLILLYFFRTKILKPVVKLSKAASKISQGNSDILVPSSEIAEVNLLSNSIISLKHGKENAEIANQNKTEFLASTVHELKNMLGGIIGLGDLVRMTLSQKPSEDPKERQAIEEELMSWVIDIIKLGEESAIFVNDILDLSQAQTGDFRIEEKEVVDLQDVTFRSIKLMKIRASKERKRIATNIDGSFNKKYIASNLDPRRIKQVIVNIISNSIKYSAENTEIKINLDHLSFEECAEINNKIELNIKNSDNINSVRKNHLLSLLEDKKNKQEGRVCIEISDQGFGMNEEELKVATQRYNNIKHDLIKNIDSTGLGLSIVKYLIEAQGGLFEIESEKQKGTKVRITF